MYKYINYMKELILSKIGNIGALSSFLNSKKNVEILDYLNSSIPIFAQEMKITEKLWYFINEVKEMQLCTKEVITDYLIVEPKNGY